VEKDEVIQRRKEDKDGKDSHCKMAGVGGGGGGSRMIALTALCSLVVVEETVLYQLKASFAVGFIVVQPLSYSTYSTKGTKHTVPKAKPRRAWVKTKLL
jgi:hypothetical protein